MWFFSQFYTGGKLSLREVSPRSQLVVMDPGLKPHGEFTFPVRLVFLVESVTPVPVSGLYLAFALLAFSPGDHWLRGGEWEKSIHSFHRTQWVTACSWHGSRHSEYSSEHDSQGFYQPGVSILMRERHKKQWDKQKEEMMEECAKWYEENKTVRWSVMGGGLGWLTLDGQERPLRGGGIWAGIWMTNEVRF